MGSDNLKPPPLNYASPVKTVKIPLPPILPWIKKKILLFIFTGAFLLLVMGFFASLQETLMAAGNRICLLRPWTLVTVETIGFAGGLFLLIAAIMLFRQRRIWIALPIVPLTLIAGLLLAPNPYAPELMNQLTAKNGMTYYSFLQLGTFEEFYGLGINRKTTLFTESYLVLGTVDPNAPTSTCWTPVVPPSGKSWKEGEIVEINDGRIDVIFLGKGYMRFDPASARVSTKP